MTRHRGWIVRSTMRRTRRGISAWAEQHLLPLGIGAAAISVLAVWFLLESYLQPEGFDERVEAIKAASSLATFLAVVIGGLWAYIKILRRREHRPRLEFSVELAFVGAQADHWLVDVQAFVNNEGLVRHVIRTFSFELRCLYPDDELVDGGPQIGHQTLIPHVLKEGSWLPGDWEATFIEPGLRTRYSFVTLVPSSVSFVLIHGLLIYGDQRVAHTAESLVRVPSAGEGPGSAEREPATSA
jgi:hypothetical protein